MRAVRLINSSRALTLCLYFAFGALAYAHLEGWAPLDSVYFLTVMATTVGYGDLCPQSAGGRLFTSFYALAGVTAVISALNPMVGWVLHSLGRVRHALSATMRSLLPRQLLQRSGGSQGSQEKDEQAPPHWGMVPIRAAASPLAALLLGAALGWRYVTGGDDGTVVDALYFSAMSMTTIGYGDMVPITAVGKLAVTAFLPMAVAALAHALSQLSHAATAEAIQRADWAGRAEALLFEAAVARGDARTTISEADFMRAVLSHHGLLDEATARILTDAFAAILFDGRPFEPDERAAAAEGSSFGRLGEGAGPPSAARVFTAEVLFRAHVRRGRIDESDGGFTQWKASAFDPLVFAATPPQAGATLLDNSII